MRAVVAKPGGGLSYEEVPDPSAGVRDVVIEVTAASVNRGDLMRRESGPPEGSSGPYVIGWDIAGLVRHIGAGVQRLQVGDRVVTRLPQGGYAEMAVAPAALCVKLPDEVSDQEGASLPVAFMTAWVALLDTAALEEGETALVHSVGSGVGLAGVQIAKRVAGATVYTTAGSDEKVARAEEFGADLAINYRTEDFLARVLEATDGRGVDVALDMVGGEVFAKSQQALARGGRLVSVGRASGQEPVEDKALSERLGLAVETGWRLSDKRTPEEWARDLAEIVALLADGTLKTVVDRVFALADVAEAHRYLESRANFGKVLLTP